MGGSFEHPKHMLKRVDKKIITLLGSINVLFLAYIHCVFSSSRATILAS